MSTNEEGTRTSYRVFLFPPRRGAHSALHAPFQEALPEPLMFRLQARPDRLFSLVMGVGVSLDLDRGRQAFDAPPVMGCSLLIEFTFLLSQAAMVAKLRHIYNRSTRPHA